jgi:acyl transferase domain-containing protein
MSESKALKDALIKIKQLKEKLKKDNEPIAIIGMGCRFPGNADTPDSFWHMLCTGVNGIVDIPPERFDVNAYNMQTRRAGLLNNIDLFDSLFFNISPAEAEEMDPQQRLLMEVAWEAFEEAGIEPESLKNSLTGVFIASWNDDYGALLHGLIDRENMSPHYGTSNVLNGMPGRLSHFFGLKGPSLLVDTACSGSLVSLHLACKSLQTRDCDLAIAGGANLVLDPFYFEMLSSGRMLSSDGYCKTFDADADGYSRGEGVGLVVLKRLSDALQDRDNILAVVRGSGVNHNGPSSRLEVPNGVAQAELIQRTLKRAGLKSTDISYVEAHGTGTALGDPIEVNALAQTYGEGRDASRPLMLGSVKSNIGHLEAAAGIASIIKTVLALGHKKIPGNLHFKTLNPKIDLESIPAVVVDTLRDWPEKPGQKRCAGISSFGFTGTNAHVILEEAPTDSVESNSAERSHHLLTLSAKTREALIALIERFRKYLEASDHNIGDIVYTANVGRNTFEYRMAVVAKNKEDLLAKLSTSTFAIVHAEIQRGSEDTELALIAASNSEELFTELANRYLMEGYKIDWKSLEAAFQRKKVVLPTYPFQRKRHWMEVLKPKTLSPTPDQLLQIFKAVAAGTLTVEKAASGMSI